MKSKEGKCATVSKSQNIYLSDIAYVLEIRFINRPTARCIQRNENKFVL